MQTIWHIPEGFATLIGGFFVLVAAAIAWLSVQRQVSSAQKIFQQQMRSTQEIETNKLRLDLYNRRFQIFVSIFDFYEALIGWKGTPDERAAQTRFFRAYQESGFLFSKQSGIEDTLESLHKKSAKVIGFKEHGEKMMSGGVEFYLQQFNEANHVLLVDFEAALPKLKAESGEYLNFHTIALTQGGRE
jgi:hypothetical protein